MTGWPAFCLIVGCFGGYIAWGCWSQHVVNRDERRRQHEQMQRDVRAAQVARDAYWREVDEERDLAAWDAEMREWTGGER